MTGGNFNTQVIAFQMYSEQYISSQTGRAAAIATILIILIVPAMFYNIKRFREQEAIR
jgi:alpha-glucoside transport system permease protein